MRKAMGDIYNKEGYFHIESLLNPGLEAWTKQEASAYAEMLEAITILGDVERVFWLIHPRGFGLILRKTPEISYSQAEKFEALECIGQGKFAARWSAQSDENAKPLGAGHSAKRDHFTRLSQNLADMTKAFKQRISASYNRSRHCVGCIWRDRAKAYNLPNNASDLSEVAAFILIQAEQQNKMECLDWPGTVSDIHSGVENASTGLSQVIQTKTSTLDQLEKLLQLQDQIRTVAGAPIKLTTRGKPAAWRPKCER